MILTLQVIWKRLYNKESGLEKGTMHQLHNLINRTTVPLNPQNDMNAAEDFMLLLLHAHVIAAAECICEMVECTDLVELANSIAST